MPEAPCTLSTQEEFENGVFTPKTHKVFSVHTTPEEFENGGFTLKTHLMFSAYTTQEEFENSTITGHLKKIPSGKSGSYFDAFVLEKLRLQNVFAVHTKTKSRRPVFVTELAWTEGLTGETKLRLQIPPK